MDERENGRVPNPARALQGWAQQQAQSLPRPPWMQQAQPPQPTFVPPPFVAATAPIPSPAYPAPADSVPNPMGAQQDGDGQRKRRWPRVVLICAGALTLFALGSCAGGLGQHQEVVGLEEELTTTSTQLAGAEAERDELQLLVGEQEDAIEAAESATDELASTLETTEADLATSQTDLATAQADLSSAQSTISERDATIAALQAELATAQAAAAPAIAPVAATPSQPQAAAPAASAYYANCTAARQAGAAPVYAGQPGYGRHLDRDGDGVGCE
ncbi:excalibur calcium-binding domain-containing protein [Agrococcus jejuensis]|uniref:Excalibur calcium-binding domain-containing protein n=1 Tax=Agrococcus jejuensis TaxID=399736 RepID=A0A1G8CHY3_9MICO|nr:excalibur calcium-binding domain-containing protein [Agrococcus jejuensis]SDH44823.1 Excalibur calcium-binding domain-containing protein [Agrococcus jejuensis]